MIIVSQNKTSIYNFNNINSIFINSYNEIRIFDNNYVEGYCGDLLGFYKTEERAKEVLKEIVQFYEISKRYETALFMEKTFVYEMPKE